MLFPKVAQRFEELVDHTERLVNLYNRNLAEELDRLAALLPDGESEQLNAPFVLDVSPQGGATQRAGNHQVAYLVEMAKVEALDAMGENRKAVELLDRYV